MKKFLVGISVIGFASALLVGCDGGKPEGVYTGDFKVGGVTFKKMYYIHDGKVDGANIFKLTYAEDKLRNSFKLENFEIKDKTFIMWGVAPITERRFEYKQDENNNLVCSDCQERSGSQLPNKLTYVSKTPDSAYPPYAQFMEDIKNPK